MTQHKNRPSARSRETDDAFEAINQAHVANKKRQQAFEESLALVSKALDVEKDDAPVVLRLLIHVLEVMTIEQRAEVGRRLLT